MSWQDLCECIRMTLRRHAATADSILTSVSQQNVVTTQGFSDANQAMGMRPREESGMSSTTVFALLLLFLFSMFLLAWNRNHQQRTAEPLHKPAGNGRRGGGGGSSGDPPSRFFDGDGIH
jgi:hypothetical protein